MCFALIVDNDAALLELMRSILERNGCESVSTLDSEQCFELIAQYHPDIVIVNDLMPRLSGGELCQRIKNDPHFAMTPVVIASAGERLRDPAYVRRIGADAVLFKPYAPNELWTLVRNLTQPS
jgi:DNA-binding response OmpR family regulator